LKEGIRKKTGERVEIGPPRTKKNLRSSRSLRKVKQNHNEWEDSEDDSNDDYR
jgi:hypothetical protein